MKIFIGSVLFVLLIQASIVLCQIRMRPSQLKLSQIGDSEIHVRDTEEAQKEGGRDKTGKSMKVPAFVVTKIDGGISPDIFSAYRSDEPRIPVLMAVKQTDQKRIKNSMANSESKKQEMKLSHQKLAGGPKLPYSEETLEAIYARSLRRDQQNNGKEHNKKLPLYHDSRSNEKQETEQTTTQPLTGTDPMAHGAAEPIPSISVTKKVIPVRKATEDIKIPVIVGFPKDQQGSLDTSESIRRSVYRLPAASTDVYTIENMLYGDRRPMHSNSIFYQKALAYLKQYRRAILQHRSYPERMADEETPKEIVRAYDPMSPLIHQQQGPTVPGGYLSSRDDSSYGRNEEQRTEQRKEERAVQSREIEREESREIPQDAIAVQDGDHNVIGFLPVISVGSGSSSYSGPSNSQSQSNAQKPSSLRKPLSPSLKLQNLLRSSRKGPRGEKTIPFLTMGLRQRY